MKGELWRDLSRIVHGATRIPHAESLKACLEDTVKFSEDL